MVYPVETVSHELGSRSMNLLSFLFRKRLPDRVVVTEDCVNRFRPDGVEESIRWDDLAEVGIVTTSDGPASEDLYWILLESDRKTGCAVPHGAEGTDVLLEALQKLPDFDNEVVIEAMGSIDEAKFTCWKRSD